MRAFVIAIALICGTSALANIQMLRVFRLAGPVEVTESAVPYPVSIIIKETSAHYEYLDSIYNIPINFFLFETIRELKTSAQSSGWINDLILFSGLLNKTIFNVPSDLGIKISIRIGIDHIWGNVPRKIQCGLFPCISNADRRENFLFDTCRYGANSCIDRADPSSPRRDRRFVSVVSGFFSDKKTESHEQQPNNTYNCPSECDVIQALGGPKLSRPEIALPSLVFFLIFAYLARIVASSTGARQIPAFGCWPWPPGSSSD